jgi:hypothetical protein
MKFIFIATGHKGGTWIAGIVLGYRLDDQGFKSQ